MYECPNCGGNLKFDIASQQLFCAHCESYIDPYAMKKETDALEGDYFETNVFLCPQCGGEMYSSDTDATAFCSYCGSANILTPRISREKRPKYIIPFQLTKEDCKKAYTKKMRGAFFVPKEYKDAKFIDSFRGIYMPYWSYHFVQQGQVNLKGTTSERKGDYVYKHHYDLLGELDAKYEGWSYDASTAFYDNISEALTPYDISQQKEFTPAYLSGFYADTADVGSETYLDEATGFANDITFEKVAGEKEFKKYDLKPIGRAKLSEVLHTKYLGADSTMYPVWFLSYRNGDKIAYATVNGQTGKVVADMPVDERRYLTGSLLLAVPIFLLLNLFLTLRPNIVLAFCALLAAYTSLLHYWELGEIYDREHNTYDRALRPSKSNKRKKKFEGSGGIASFLVFLLAAGGLCVLSRFSDVLLILVWCAALAMNFAVTGFLRSDKKKKKKRMEELAPEYKAFGAAVLANVIGALVAFLRPVSDLWYYGCVIPVVGAMLYNIMHIMKKYNRLAMRKLPQFEKKGGDDNA